MSLTTPTLLLWGRNDRRHPVTLARGLRALRPDVDLRVFPTGPAPQEEAPDSFLSAVMVWMSQRARV